MSYDYFLWRTNRFVTPDEVDETTVLTWTDIDAIRTTIAGLLPTMKWTEGGMRGDDCSGASSVGAVSLPTPGKKHDPLVVRASHRVDSGSDLLRIGQALACMVYDTQTGKIVYQPEVEG